tara:strand:- start:376 stop:948 length:573 start_codon:yes stop_codon:yes gene_type:complete
MIEKVSLEISDYWVSNGYLTESNDNCGTLVAFDWVGETLTTFNTNINLNDYQIDSFKFETLINLLKSNGYNLVLGLRNVQNIKNPSEGWTNTFKDNLVENSLKYHEYITNKWPSPIPKFDVDENVFILRYCYDEFSKIDNFAANELLFQDWIKETDFEKYLHERNWKTEEKRIIILINEKENLVLYNGEK